MANDRPQSLRTDDFVLISAGEEIILRSLSNHQSVRLDDTDGNLLEIAAANAGDPADTHIDVQQDGAEIVADATALNLTGTAVDVTDAGGGVATATVTDTDTDTHTGASDDGTQVYDSVDDINFGTDLVVTDDGDTTVTVDAAHPTQTTTHQFALSQIPDTEAAVMRLFVPAGQTLTIYRGGLQDDTGGVPTGLDLRVYDETNATEAHVFTSKYGDPADPTVDGGTDGVDVTFELRNQTGAQVNASGWLEYALI